MSSRENAQTIKRIAVPLKVCFIHTSHAIVSRLCVCVCVCVCVFEGERVRDKLKEVCYCS